jgi:hypothetical protein
LSWKAWLVAFFYFYLPLFLLLFRWILSYPYRITFDVYQKFNARLLSHKVWADWLSWPHALQSLQVGVCALLCENTANACESLWFLILVLIFSLWCGII